MCGRAAPRLYTPGRDRLFSGKQWRLFASARRPISS